MAEPNIPFLNYATTLVVGVGGIVGLFWGGYKALHAHQRDRIRQEFEDQEREDRRRRDAVQGAEDIITQLQRQLIDARDRAEREHKEKLDLLEKVTRSEAARAEFDPIHTVYRVIKTWAGGPDSLCWCKERLAYRDYRMVAVSKDYAQLILKAPPENYEGRRDSDLWDMPTAKQFADEDEAVYEAADTIHVANIDVTLPGGDPGTFKGRKWHVRVGDRDLIFGAGRLVEGEAE